MFESYAEVNRVNKRKKWTTLAAVAGQISLVAVLAALPLWFPAPVEVPEEVTPIVAPPPSPLPPPPSGHAAVAPKAPVRQFDPSKLSVPQNTQQQPAPVAGPVTEDPPSIDNGPANGVIGGVTGGQLGGVLGGIIGAEPSAAPPPPPPPPPAPAPATPSEIRVGGNIQAARLLSAPQPAYPFAAQGGGRTRRRDAQRRDRARWKDREPVGSQRSLATGFERNGRGQAVAVSADRTQWQSGDGEYANRGALPDGVTPTVRESSMARIGPPKPDKGIGPPKPNKASGHRSPIKHRATQSPIKHRATEAR